VTSIAFAGLGVLLKGVGPVIPGVELRIADPVSGEPVRPGEDGEICVRGPQVMRGYWNAPEETAQAFFPGHWLRTGDLGRMDSRGWVEFVERRKDVIVVSGFKAYPSEIEQVALAPHTRNNVATLVLGQ